MPQPNPTPARAQFKAQLTLLYSVCACVCVCLCNSASYRLTCLLPKLINLKEQAGTRVSVCVCSCLSVCVFVVVNNFEPLFAVAALTDQSRAGLGLGREFKRARG